MGVAQSNIWSKAACVKSYISKAKRRIGSHSETDFAKVQKAGGMRIRKEGTQSKNNWAQHKYAPFWLLKWFTFTTLHWNWFS